MAEEKPNTNDIGAIEKKASTKGLHASLRRPLFTISTHFVVSMLGLALIGYYLDKRLGNNRYYLTLLGLFIGYIWGFYELMKIVRKLQAQDTKTSKENDTK